MTISHLLVDCQRWEEERQWHLNQVLGQLKGMEKSKHGRLVLMLGGKSQDRQLENWLPSKGKAGDQPSHGGDGARTYYVAFQVAAFLQQIAGARHAVLSKVKVDLGDTRDCLSLQSQGPMGRVCLDRLDLG